MDLPSLLAGRIAEILKEIDPSHLKSAAADLSRRYRSLKRNQFISSDLHHMAYLSTRLPATYAVNATVLNQLSFDGFQVKSLLDLGAGPGIVMWAAALLWPELAQITLIEQDSGFIRLGKILSQGCGIDAFQNAQWQQGELSQFRSLSPHDLISLSYVLGELDQSLQAHTLQKAWEATLHALVVIEPGTPAGFQHLLKARSWLIRQGATIFAPCPHNLGCPLQENNWCHFSVRLKREVFHRHAKQAPLGFEDEKYSYIIARKIPGFQKEARIISKPRIRKGQVILDLCSVEGQRSLTISKKNPLYAKARKVSWGEGWS